jgi:hypothetical protein
MQKTVVPEPCPPAATPTLAGGTEQPVPKPGAARSDGKHPKEIGGPAGPEPTRYGDWERKGRCIDF